MTVPVAPGTLEEFLKQADDWLAARYPRGADTADRRFVWGEGDDEVRVFQEPDPEQEADALPTILRHGSQPQKQDWLPRLYRGEQIACQLFSEPDAGSDLAAVRTQVVRDGDGWRISGQKAWTSGAHLADVGEIICRTADQPRHRNLTPS